jgi:hypothetical protein
LGFNQVLAFGAVGGKMKRIALIAVIAVIAAFAGCEKKAKDTGIETNAAVLQDNTEDSRDGSGDVVPPDDTFEIRIYTFMFDPNWMEHPGRNPIWYEYETIAVSRSRMRDDTFEYAKSLGITSHGDLRYCANIRYEGNKLIVDFSGGIKQSMEGGGTAVAASAYKEQTIFQTLLSFPDVEELEFYIDGAQETYWSDESGRSDFSYTRNAADMKKALENYSYGNPENSGAFGESQVITAAKAPGSITGNYHFYADSQAGERIIFYAKDDVKSFAYMEITHSEDSKGNITILAGDVLFDLDDFTRENPFVVTVDIAEGIPTRGIRFSHGGLPASQAALSYFYLSESGMDGSISLVEFYVY